MIDIQPKQMRRLVENCISHSVHNRELIINVLVETILNPRAQNQPDPHHLFVSAYYNTLPELTIPVGSHVLVDFTMVEYYWKINKDNSIAAGFMQSPDKLKAVITHHVPFSLKGYGIKYSFRDSIDLEDSKTCIISPDYVILDRKKPLPKPNFGDLL